MLSACLSLRVWLTVLVGWLLEVGTCVGAGAAAIPQAKLRTAIGKALPLIERSAAQTLKAKDCFTCHHGAHGAMVQNEAWSRGFRLQRNGLQDQLARAYGELVTEQPRFKKGFSVSNTADGPGHALWMLHVAGWERDAITDGAVEFFLGQQRREGNWETSPARSPTVGSSFTVTFLALRTLKYYGKPEQVRESLARAEAWLLKTAPEDTEDRVYRLRALHLLEKQEAVEVEVAALKAEQRKDGGWTQMKFLDSDAYATGTVLAALVDTGAISVVSAEYQRGAGYLVREQKSDGSWHVKKRTRGQQPMFESGFPHGQDQFISYSASCWATYALLKAMPVDKRRGRTGFVSSVGEGRLKKMANDEIRP
ncbi:MAG: squalene/oxidosqualene cyclase [Verrucomicrobia bacterium]|jgi:N-acyl-D-amino-acid deacylase|nr:squalene/oxidosqualene cyclase [Verrucomicrobiota bacterium]